ncbi:hypothetical protein [Sodalis glossinidius]|uniref:hypothetical protein n=1 Tax=Sodalis glossinidius TaxID=63612 RepID=UPI0011D12B8A|nr:hypothetical protein [Sodalis glossinidius]
MSAYLHRTFVKKGRLTGITWTGEIGYAQHTFGDGGVIVGVKANAYITSTIFAVRYFQLLVGDTWVSVVND